jgi:2-oxo-4-hydroxy-4-carboxy-5-ureidoimidazoline decarboxylase
MTRIESFNRSHRQECVDLLLACVAIPRWAHEVADGRPYADARAVAQRAREAADPWTDEELDAALSRHPRIGERAEGREADAAHSRREQAGVATADPEVLRRLTEGNEAYEQRFGHVFLIRAAGRSPEEILEALEERMTNDPQTERRVLAEQLREIAVLRLEGALQ